MICQMPSHVGVGFSFPMFHSQISKPFEALTKDSKNPLSCYQHNQYEKLLKHEQYAVKLSACVHLCPKMKFAVWLFSLSTGPWRPNNCHHNNILPLWSLTSHRGWTKCLTRRCMDEFISTSQVLDQQTSFPSSITNTKTLENQLHFQNNASQISLLSFDDLPVKTYLNLGLYTNWAFKV